MKKILILTSFPSVIEPDSVEYQKESSRFLYAELQKEFEVDLCRYVDLTFHFSSAKTTIRYKERGLEEYDFIIFRTITLIETHNMSFHHIARVVAEFAHDHDIPTLNGVHLVQFPSDFNKLYQMYKLAHQELLIPETWSVELSEELTREQDSQFIIKPMIGSHGNHIERYKAAHPNASFYYANHLVQEMLEGAADYRILVLGGKCLGAMKRTASDGMIVSNFSAGGSVEQVELTREMETLALKSTELFKLDFSGVDLMKNKEGRLVILEVNRFPEFNGFQLATGLDVASSIKNYIKEVL